MNDEEMITLQSDDGEEHRCRVLGVFEFEDEEYALLLDEDGPGADPDAVLMRVTEQAGEKVFQPIDDDETFERVSAHVQELAQSLDDDGASDD